MTTEIAVALEALRMAAAFVAIVETLRIYFAAHGDAEGIRLDGAEFFICSIAYVVLYAFYRWWP